MATIECRDCEQSFTPNPNKPGYYDQCPVCAEKMGDVELLGGNMIWHHKTAPYMELKSLSSARSFAKQTQRFGAGPLRSIVQSREDPSEPGCKLKSGAEPGAQYNSSLGEKRSVKR